MGEKGRLVIHGFDAVSVEFYGKIAGRVGISLKFALLY